MPVLIRPANNFLAQVIRSASEGKYNTVNNITFGEVTFQKRLNSGTIYFHLKIATSHKHSPLVPTRAYMKLGRAALCGSGNQSSVHQASEVVMDTGLCT